MEDVLREKLLDAGVNIETAMERFMNNEKLLEKFLKKFPQDPNYEELLVAVAEKRYEDAFKAAHTLKGVCGNLSLESLYENVCTVVELLRNGGGEEIETALPNVKAEYERVVAILETI
ncbi:MAG: Hpt domain-containing protein [Clostridium sp.]|nr:Hpt domain-containing protein [Clostridium sp.]MCM1173064.1 Hpt domain-containing protein [Clostridium sp.]MCM1209301.1 Hpt domain-containing protein [Ruminococcus sp.]